MKRWLTHLFIGSYLSVLSLGVFAHATHLYEGSHPGMYFIVWDMFCGWTGYSTRFKMVAEGESGEMYQLTPAPWREFHPYGDLGRHDYDPTGRHAIDVARNVLRQTSHERITRIHVFEEFWAHKYNLPDNLWAELYERPKQKKSYFHLRSMFLADGTQLQDNGGWLDVYPARMLMKNPRLVSLRPGTRFTLNPSPDVAPSAEFEVLQTEPSQPVRAGN